jgi:hypothetical protein
MLFNADPVHHTVDILDNMAQMPAGHERHIGEANSRKCPPALMEHRSSGQRRKVGLVSVQSVQGKKR